MKILVDADACPVKEIIVRLRFGGERGVTLIAILLSVRRERGEKFAALSDFSAKYRVNDKLNCYIRITLRVVVRWYLRPLLDYFNRLAQTSR